MKFISKVFTLMLLIVYGMIVPMSSANADASIFTTTLVVPQNFYEESAERWVALANILTKVPNRSIVTLKVQGIGGAVMYLERIADSILDARQRGVVVNMKVIGPAQSSHAMLLCYATNVSFVDGSSAMFHSMAYPDAELFGLVPIRNIDLSPPDRLAQDGIFAQCKYAGFLTEEDIAIIKQNRDVTAYIRKGKLRKIYSNDLMGPEAARKQEMIYFTYLLGVVVVVVVIKKI